MAWRERNTCRLPCRTGTKNAPRAGMAPAAEPPKPAGPTMLHGVLVILFAIATGFTASGIAANLYRLVASKPETTRGKIVYAGVMVLAGPSVLFENAATSFRAKKCSSLAFWMAAAVACYWSFALGLFVLGLYLGKA